MKFESLSEETKQRVAKIQAQLDEMEVRNLGLTPNPNFKVNNDDDFEEFVKGVCDFFESYLSGNYTVMPDFGDATHLLEPID